MNPPPAGEETASSHSGGTAELPVGEVQEPAAAPESLEDSIERLRGPRAGRLPAPEPKARPARLPMQPLWVGLAVGVVLLSVWGAIDVANRVQTANNATVVFGRTANQVEPIAAGGLPPVSSTSTTVAAPPVAQPAAVTTVPVEVTTTTSAPPTTTTTTTRPPTTTTTVPPPVKPRPVPSSSSTAVGSGVQLTLSAAPPASGEVRTAGFRLESEFGDVRVMRSLRIEFGDGDAIDGSVLQWSCFDPAAPNPYVFVGPSHVYAAPGTYTVTATVRTAPCSVPDGAELAEETAQVRLTLVVP